jgi:L-threonylcarbamoyladenylate synthase
VSYITVKEGANLIKSGKVVAFPTETVYGLGGDYSNKSAIDMIYSLKGRPRNNPLILHLLNLSWLSRLEIQFTTKIKYYLECLTPFIPGPLTLVLPCKAGSVAVRYPKHPVAQELLNLSDTIVAAPSANLSNKLSPTAPYHVRSHFPTLPIIDGGETEYGVESTVIRLGERIELLRPGSVSREEISSQIGEDLSEYQQRPSSAYPSPGMLKVHYSPNTPISFLDEWLIDRSEKKCRENLGVILFQVREDLKISGVKVVKLLSKSGNLEEVARKLFLTLHELDSLNLDLILVDRCEAKGIGEAIMDRLNRAMGI